ncbi:dual specificity protein phosphatase family protein [Flavobacterium frigoris]|uniref:Dual specificity protein phosphatase n=1 Tax=Flavobacterium frigoris (strain PS1) TaxID=1086011 RepID=H7FLH5_FLAFP|nr:dual specificity protein phosphatase family protein [Flavobacterium frigoris]EIA10517.1 dual specificity protein phosphatase [Flavobacterium frigoris PS1]
MSKKAKIIGLSIFGVLMILVCKYVYDMNINHNFETITEGKVYKSGVIPPDQIASYVKEYHIKSIVDLRMPGTNDLVLNPEIPGELQAEKTAVAKIGGVNYFSNPSEQVPNKENIAVFTKIMDNKDNYPVLIHCYHGTGRAEMYAALYRIEYESFTNEAARQGVRTLITFSSFDDGTPKGEYLKAYKSRSELASKQ